MSTPDLETELARLRGEDRPPSRAVRLTQDEALAYRNSGNIPDVADRTLRLVLDAGRDDLDARRRLFEPDFHAAPEWRRPGSAPVTVVPLPGRMPRPVTDEAWWEDSELAPLENEWRETGTVAGLEVDPEFRGFVYKTVLSLRKAGDPVTAATVTDSIARLVSPSDAARIRAAVRPAG